MDHHECLLAFVYVELYAIRPQFDRARERGLRVLWKLGAGAAMCEQQGSLRRVASAGLACGGNQVASLTPGKRAAYNPAASSDAPLHSDTRHGLRSTRAEVAPDRFATMVGQEHVLRALVHALEADRLHHAYLFTGTRGRR